MIPNRSVAIAGALFLLLPVASAQRHRLSGTMPAGVTGDVAELALSPDGSWLVYRAVESVNLELFSVPIGGGAVTKLNAPLVQGGSVSGGFQISADSSRVVYLADQDVDGVFELYSVPMAGGVPTKLNPTLAASGDVIDFAIDPGSSRVVYRADQDVFGVRELYSVPIDGGTGGPATRLNPALVAGGDVEGFAIAPDSSRVLYRADQEVNNTFDLYSVPLAGGAATKLNGPLLPNGVSTRFAIAPDSARAVYLADQDGDGKDDLCSVPIDGGGAFTLLTPVLVAGGHVGTFAISPDSGRVVYRADQDVNDAFELHAVSIQGGAVLTLNPALAPGEDVAPFAIAPDSSRIVYMLDQGLVNELWSVPIDGGAANRLNPALVEDGSVQVFAISPDSSRVVYRADQDVSGMDELYGVPIDGGAGGAAVKLSATLVASGDVSSFSISPDSSRVVYLADQDMESIEELYSAPITGGTGGAGGPVVQINPPSPLLTEVRSGFLITPDSSTIAYLSDQDLPDVFQAYRAPSAGGPALKLSGPLASVPSAGDVASQAVSPDGQRVVYLADQDVDGVFELYSVPARGGPITRLNGPMLGQGDVQSFAVSPDSARVVYLANEELVDCVELFSVPIAGGGGVKLNPDLGSGGRVEAFAITSDSSRVVYEAERVSAFGYDIDELYGVPIDGGPSTRLDQPLPFPPPIGISGFEVSPDGTRVIYRIGDESGAPGWNPYGDIFSVPVAGGTPIQLSHTLRYCLDWLISPDSSRVVYTAEEDELGLYELYSVPIHGGSATKLNVQLGGGSVGVVIPCPFPSCIDDPPSFTPTWAKVSPDSTRVVYTASAMTGAQRELYSVPTSGGSSALLSVPLPASFQLQDDFEISPDSGRVVYAGPSSDGSTNALYSVPIDGGAGGASIQLNGALVPGGAIQVQYPDDSLTALEAHYGIVSPDSTRVVYLADQEEAGVLELYSAPILGGPALKLNAPLAGGGDVGLRWTAISPDSRFVLYLADQVADDVVELFRAPLAGGTPVKKLSGPLVPGGDVLSLLVSPSSNLVFYLADEDIDETVELYASLVTSIKVDRKFDTKIARAQGPAAGSGQRKGPRSSTQVP